MNVNPKYEIKEIQKLIREEIVGVIPA